MCSWESHCTRGQLLVVPDIPRTNLIRVHSYSGVCATQRQTAFHKYTHDQGKRAVKSPVTSYSKVCYWETTFSACKHSQYRMSAARAKQLMSLAALKALIHPSTFKHGLGYVVACFRAEINEFRVAIC